MNNLTGILLTFHQHPVALICDVKKISSMYGKQTEIFCDFCGGEMET